jgi:hypothetical protein
MALKELALTSSRLCASSAGSDPANDPDSFDNYVAFIEGYLLTRAQAQQILDIDDEMYEVLAFNALCIREAREDNDKGLLLTFLTGHLRVTTLLNQLVDSP